MRKSTFNTARQLRPNVDAQKSRIVSLVFQRRKSLPASLSRKDDTGEAIGTTNWSCPCRKRRAELIFPFLVLEAKSEKAGSSGTGVQLQTACSIVTLLQIQ